MKREKFFTFSLPRSATMPGSIVNDEPVDRRKRCKGAFVLQTFPARTLYMLNRFRASWYLLLRPVL
jgi:hypothetical protein